MSQNLQVPPEGHGVYEEFRLSNKAVLDRLKQIADGGFRLVLNYSSLVDSNTQQLLAYADQARALGIKIIWPLHPPAFWDGTDLTTHYPTLAADCNCSGNAGFISYLLTQLSGHPATWGYYIGDELEPSVHTQWKTHTDLVKQLDPNHPRLVVQGTLANSYGNASLTTFADGAEVLGQDYYPIGVSYLVPYTQTGDVVRSVQSLTDQAGRDSAIILQAYSWRQYYPPARCSPWPDCAPYPTMEQMQEMLTMTLQNAHPRFIFWYSFFDILRSDNPTAHWNDLLAAISNTTGP